MTNLIGHVSNDPSNCQYSDPDLGSEIPILRTVSSTLRTSRVSVTFLFSKTTLQGLSSALQSQTVSMSSGEVALLSPTMIAVVVILGCETISLTLLSESGLEQSKNTGSGLV